MGKDSVSMIDPLENTPVFGKLHFVRFDTPEQDVY